MINKTFSSKNKNINYHINNMVEVKVLAQTFNKATGIDDIHFSNIGFKDCTFKEIEFKNVRFSNVLFEDCIFELCKFKHCNIGYQSFLEIFGGNLDRSSFERCNLNGVFIKRCRINGVSFKNTFMGKCNLIGNSYNSVRFIDDCNLIDCIIKDTSCCMDILFINENSYTKLSYGSCIGEFNYKDNYYCLKNKSKHQCSKKDLNISNSYMALGNQYLKNDIQDKYGECFYESKRAKHRTLRGMKRFVSAVSNFVCGYGEKPYRSFGTSLIVIVLCSILYLFAGLETKVRIIDYNNFSLPRGVSGLLEDFLYCIHFSVVTFSTVGYGDLVPYGSISMIISNFEIIFGVIMVAIWTSTLVRKMTR